MGVRARLSRVLGFAARDWGRELLWGEKTVGIGVVSRFWQRGPLWPLFTAIKQRQLLIWDSFGSKRVNKHEPRFRLFTGDQGKSDAQGMMFFRPSDVARDFLKPPPRPPKHKGGLSCVSLPQAYQAWPQALPILGGFLATLGGEGREANR